MGELRNAYKILVGIHERKRPLHRSKRRRKNNIITNMYEDVGSAELPQKRIQ
jgi:hypothetical protein